MISIPLYWWYIPIALVIASLVTCLFAANARGGMFAGFYETLLAVALMGAAILTLVTGYIAR